MQVISVILIIMVLLLLGFFSTNILAYWKANFIWFSLFLLQYFWFYIKKLK